jgi:hypothetical protein
MINAPVEKVWESLWQPKNYTEWTSVFSEGSYAKSDWNEGSDIEFLSPDGGGMYSSINKKVENKLMSFRHIGEVKGFQRLPLDEKTKKWSGATEVYNLFQKENGTELVVDMDMVEEYESYFTEKFPVALSKVKEIAERNS